MNYRNCRKNIDSFCESFSSNDGIKNSFVTTFFFKVLLRRLRHLHQRLRFHRCHHHRPLQIKIHWNSTIMSILSKYVHIVWLCPDCPIMSILSNYVHIVQLCPYCPIMSILSNYVNNLSCAYRLNQSCFE